MTISFIFGLLFLLFFILKTITFVVFFLPFQGNFFLQKYELKSRSFNNTHRFHDGNMFLSDQCSLLLIGQILITIDSLDLILKLLLSSCDIMMGLHERTVP